MNRSWFTGLCLVVLLLPVTGVNGEILRVSADQVNLRSAPSLSAPIQRQLFRSNLVTILARGATELEIQGKRGKWVRVSVLDCSDFNCSAGSQGNQTGWMFDAFLDPRPFMRVTSWHGSFYNGCVGDYCISYRVGSDGRFSYTKQACADGNCGENQASNRCHYRSEIFQLATNECHGSGVLFQSGKLVCAISDLFDRAECFTLVRGEWVPFVRGLNPDYDL